MDNGSIWGHGGYLGPDFSAACLHNLAVHLEESWAARRYGRPLGELTDGDRVVVAALVRSELKQNRFVLETATLTFTDGQVESHRRQLDWWADYFFLNPPVMADCPGNFLPMAMSSGV